LGGFFDVTLDIQNACAFVPDATAAAIGAENLPETPGSDSPGLPLEAGFSARRRMVPHRSSPQAIRESVERSLTADPVFGYLSAASAAIAARSLACVHRISRWGESNA
jgi:hypothetical protein